MQHTNGAAGTDARANLLHGGQQRGRQRRHERQLLRQARLPQPVALVHDAAQECFIGGQVVKVTAAAQQQVLCQRALERAIGRFDVSILIRTVHMNGARLHAEVGEQLQILCIVAARGLTCRAPFGSQMMGSRRAVVGLMDRRHVPQLRQCALQSQPDGDQRLRLDHAAPLPVRVGQHAVDQQMREGLAAQRDPQRVHRGAIGLQHFARPMHLLERQQLVTMQCAPGADVPLQRAQLAFLIRSGPAFRQPAEQHRRIQLRCFLQHRFDLGPVCGKRIHARAIAAWLLAFARQLTELFVFPYCPAVCIGFRSRLFLRTAFCAVLS